MQLTIAMHLMAFQLFAYGRALLAHRVMQSDERLLAVTLPFPTLPAGDGLAASEGVMCVCAA